MFKGPVLFQKTCSSSFQYKPKQRTAMFNLHLVLKFLKEASSSATSPPVKLFISHPSISDQLWVMSFISAYKIHGMLLFKVAVKIGWFRKLNTFLFLETDEE